MDKKKLIIGVVISVVVVIIVIVGSNLISSGNKNEQNNQNNDISGINETEIDTDIKTDEDVAITINDEELEKVIRKEIDKQEGDLYMSDFESIYYIKINFKDYPVRDISELKYATNLSDFSYRYGELVSLNPLSKLKNLTTINISYSTIEEKINDFDHNILERITFIDTNISDYNFIKDYKTIKSITLTRCNVSSLEFLQNMNELERVMVSSNNISDITPLKNKVNLKILWLHQNQVSDIDVLRTCTMLEQVNISFNNVTNIEPLSQLQKLESITAYELHEKKIIDRNQIQQFIDKGVKVDYTR